jgi:hypothetical protein
MIGWTRDFIDSKICLHDDAIVHNILAIEVPRLKYEIRKWLFPENFMIKIKLCDKCKAKYDDHFQKNELTIYRGTPPIQILANRDKKTEDELNCELTQLEKEGKHEAKFIKNENGLFHCDLYPHLLPAAYVFYQYEIDDFYTCECKYEANCRCYSGKYIENK